MMEGTPTYREIITADSWPFLCIATKQYALQSDSKTKAMHVFNW